MIAGSLAHLHRRTPSTTEYTYQKEDVMIYHTVRLSFRPGVTQDQIDGAIAQWHKMAEEIPVIESYCIGHDLGGKYDYGATFVLQDIAAYEAFVMHPSGRETDLIGLPLVDDAVSMDITDDGDPAIGAKIDAIHRARFERDPEVLEIVNGLTYAGSGLSD